MVEIRFHGRGGQGTVNAAQLLAKAVVKQGEYAQFIPAFGVERKGSPVFGYFRMDTKTIWPKNQVYYPNGVVILDDSLRATVPVFEGLKEDSFVILNTKLSAEEIELPEQVKTFAYIDATSVAAEVIGREIPNTVMLGALVKAVGGVDKDILSALIAEKYGKKNADAFEAGFDRAEVIKR